MLEVNGVNSFYGKAQVLNDLNFTVDRGTVVALLGRNGAGKTTTMKSIMQLVRPRQGKIIYQGARKSTSMNASNPQQKINELGARSLQMGAVSLVASAKQIEGCMNTQQTVRIESMVHTINDVLVYVAAALTADLTRG